jgi:sulfide:quinone oxidoreductase
MPSTRSTSESFNVLIAGGGVAALEAALALRDLGGEAFEITLLAPNADFVYRPMTVREPFACGPAERHPLGEIAADLGLELLVDSFAWVDAPHRVVHTEAGDRIPYDALILALGAHPHPRYDQAITIDDRRLDELLHGLIQDVEGGYVHRLAFVVPDRVAWPLPLYELALMTGRRAYDMNVELEITIVTPEEAPLAVFGAGSGVAELLAERAIATITSVSCGVPDSRHVVVDGERTLEVDRVIALPELYGPSVRGLKLSAHGFIPIDGHCRVHGVERVFAAGDATDFPVKHGSLASQQADTAARAIAALAGMPVEATPLDPVIRGILLTGGAPLHLSARISGGRGFRAEIADATTWTPPAKIAARYLAPYLDALDSAALLSR